jgi:hypothetical protein
MSILATYCDTGSGYVMRSACAKADVTAMTRYFFSINLRNKLKNLKFLLLLKIFSD